VGPVGLREVENRVGTSVKGRPDSLETKPTEKEEDNWEPAGGPAFGMGSLGWRQSSCQLANGRGDT
jgi:hypothetical protein